MEYSTRQPAFTADENESTPSERVVNAVARAKDADPLDLDPLYTVVDPDALDAIVTSQRPSGVIQQSSVEVQFDYQGYHVTVTGDGTVDLVAQ